MWLLACSAPEPVDTATTTETGVAAPTTIPAQDDSGEEHESAAETAPPAWPGLRFTEAMPKNHSVAEDEAGEEDDWIELANPTADAVDLGGWLLVDEAQGAWAFPAGTTLAGGGHLLVWLDGRTGQPGLQAGLRLDDGGTIELRAPDHTPVATLAWPALEADVAWARIPEAGEAWVATAAATPGASNPDEAGSADPSGALFPEGEVLELALEVGEAEMDTLEEDAEAWVEATIRFDGVTLGPVGLKRKGSTGSARPLDGKTAFRVDLDPSGARLRGLEELTLNSMVQDASFVHEQLAYAFFRDLGVPAPRTAYVALTLNGEYRGLYLHVETEDERFLARWYANPDGNLYEGGSSVDLTLDEYLLLEQDEQGSADPDDYSDLAAVAALLAGPADAAAVVEMEARVNLDECLQMWAVEVMTGHWDGYFWFPHNYRVYHDPDADRLEMIPWGADLTFEEVRGALHARAELGEWLLSVAPLYDTWLGVLDDTATRMSELDLGARARELHALGRPWYEADPYAEFDLAASDAALDDVVAFVAAWPDAVHEGVRTGVDPGNDRVP